MFFKHASLRGLPHHQVRSGPDDIEVTAAGGDLTFHELKAGADRLGSHLAALGAAPDTCVGLCAEPSADLVTGVWGILTAGAAYLPLSPDYPEARLRYMVENAGVRIVVTQPHPGDRLESLVPRGTIVVTAADAPETGNPLRPDGPQAHHLAYVIHTSGSTGKPKGVMIEQRSIVSRLRRLANCGHLGPDVSILQKTPMSFDAAQWEILACAVGARVVMGAPGLFRNPEGILKPLGEEVVERRHVIAIDQGVYDRSAIGISAVSRAGEEQRHYVVLGTLLHHLQRTGHMGFMSSGSSSKTGNPLPASRRLDDLLAEAGIPAAPASYFFVGGRITPGQAAHEGMDEDAVHTNDPAETIRDDLAQFLPDYMIPARVVVNELPLTVNGKIDAKATARLPEVAATGTSAVHIAPATPTGQWLAAVGPDTEVRHRLHPGRVLRRGRRLPARRGTGEPDQQGVRDTPPAPGALRDAETPGPGHPRRRRRTAAQLPPGVTAPRRLRRPGVRLAGPGRLPDEPAPARPGRPPPPARQPCRRPSRPWCRRILTAAVLRLSDRRECGNHPELIQDATCWGGWKISPP